MATSRSNQPNQADGIFNIVVIIITKSIATRLRNQVCADEESLTRQK
jgi:hypothetical protein